MSLATLVLLHSTMTVPVATAMAENLGAPMTETGAAAMSAAFYADASCLLTVGGRSSVGRTEIDADVGTAGSRMLFHCDTEDGHRLTMLARGDRLERDARVTLLSRADFEGGADGIIAWLTRAGTRSADESVPRRYIARGHVVIRETASMQIDDMALQGDRMVFARIDGELERRSDRPDDEAAPSAD